MSDTETLFQVEGGRTARISPCGQYRYSLSRRWANGPSATFVMLNPSTADANQDDPTIRRCIGFARAWGLGGLRVVNLYAFRATKPADLRKAADPVGPDNDRQLQLAAGDAFTMNAPLVAAWGANAKPERVAQVLALPGFDRLTALGVTKDGQPRHPLYLRSDLTPERWPS